MSPDRSRVRRAVGETGQVSSAYGRNLLLEIWRPGNRDPACPCTGTDDLSEFHLTNRGEIVGSIESTECAKGALESMFHNPTFGCSDEQLAQPVANTLFDNQGGGM